MNKENTFTFASVSFANAVPFTHFLQSVSPTSHVVYDPPAKLADLLLEGAVDAALVPVFDLFANPSLKMVDNIGISANGSTTSTLLKCYCPLHEVEEVMEDKYSSTSNALAAILMPKHLNISAQMKIFTEGAEVDAEVLIGDRALCSELAPFGDYDLSGEWQAMTGLPFVFAVWACRDECQYSDELAKILRDSLDMGEKHIDEIADAQAERLKLPSGQCREYLSDIICYRLGEEELKGMAFFKKMLENGEGEGS